MQHSIRIFLSSTFKDLQKERDYLVTKVFPALLELAEERGVPFSWCDLRFGVASFDQEYTLKLCLNNIELSSPSFIGLIGDSYGSIPCELDKKQINSLSVFKGVPKMVKKQMGFTEIEMRYFLNNYSDDNSLDFYFFVGNKDTQSIAYESKSFLSFIKHPIFTIANLIKGTKEDRLLQWKKFVLNNTKQSFVSNWHLHEDSNLDADLVYQTLKEAIECKFKLPKCPKEELYWNEQHTFLENILTKTYNFFNFDCNSRFIDRKDILNLYSPNATGKTYFAAYQINRANKAGTLCFFYFVGGSRVMDTPITIWKGVLYQVCKFINKDYTEYTSISSCEQLRNALSECLQTIKRETLIVIDGFGDDVSCSIEHRNTILSDFPDPQTNIKYIVTSNEEIPNTSRSISFEYSGAFLQTKKFLQLYLHSNCELSDINCLMSSLGNETDIRIAKHSADEFLIKKNYSCTYNDIAERILNQLSHKNQLLGDQDDIFYQGLYETVIYLSITKQGILESNICKVCNINAEQWTIVYGYLSPYFKSLGNIKLPTKLAEEFLNRCDNVDKLRQKYIERIRKYNSLPECLKEILYQASYLDNRFYLCDILSEANNLCLLYDIDINLIPEFLTIIEKHGLLKQFQDSLDNCIENHDIGIENLNKIVTTFYKVFPRYAIARHYIEISDKYCAGRTIDTGILANYHSIKAELCISCGQYNVALGIVKTLDDLIDKSKEYAEQYGHLMVKNLLLKAKLYNNDFQTISPKIKALEYYRQIIDEYNHIVSKEMLLDILHDYIMLNRNNDVSKCINDFYSLYSNNSIVREQSLLYWKHKNNVSTHKLVLNRYDAESPEVDNLLDKMLSEIDEALIRYPFSVDILSQLGFFLDLSFARIKKLSKKNIFDQYRENVIIMQHWVEKYVYLSDLIYSKDSKDFAVAMFKSSDLYKELSFINPLLESEYLNRSLEYSIIAENTYDKINQSTNLLTAIIYHNRADIYTKLSDYDNALACINNAISIKEELHLHDESRIFISFKRRVEILLDHILHTTDITSANEYITLCRHYIDDLKLDFIQNPKEIHFKDEVQKMETEFSLYVNNERERQLKLAYLKFEKFKRCHKTIQVENKRADKSFVQVLTKYIGFYLDLKNYIDKHDLMQEFCERHNDYYPFEEHMNHIGSILESIVSCHTQK